MRRPFSSVPMTLITSGPVPDDTPGSGMGRDARSPAPCNADEPNVAAIPSMSSRPHRKPVECGLADGVSGSQEIADSLTGMPFRSCTRALIQISPVGPRSLFTFRSSRGKSAPSGTTVT